MSWGSFSWTEIATAIGVLGCFGMLWEINLKLKAIHFMMQHDFDRKHGLNDD